MAGSGQRGVDLLISVNIFWMVTSIPLFYISTVRIIESERDAKTMLITAAVGVFASLIK